MMPPAFLKPELCLSFTEGQCNKGAECPFAHNLRELAPGGYKPKLCPAFLRGGCPRKEVCLFAHDKKELPPNFKCMTCNNYSRGNCRTAQICKFAHGEEEQQWFINFMKPDPPPNGYADPGIGEGGEFQTHQQAVAAAMRQAMGGKPAPAVQAAPPAGAAEMANNVVAAAQLQLTQGTAIPGQLQQLQALSPVLLNPALTGMQLPGMPPRPRGGPSHTPKLNLAKNPAMKAPGWREVAVAASKGAVSKGSAPPPGLVTPVGVPPKYRPPIMRPPLPPLNDVMSSGPGMDFGMTGKAGGFPGIRPPPAMVAPLAAAPEPETAMSSEGLDLLERLGALEAYAASPVPAAVPVATPPKSSWRPTFAAPAMAPAKAPAPLLSAKAVCVQFEMGGCTKDNCPYSHDI